MQSIVNNRGGSCGVQQPKRKRKIHSARQQWQGQQWDNIMKSKVDYASNTDHMSHWPLVNQAQQEWQNATELQDCDLSPNAVSNFALSNGVAAMVPISPRSCVIAGGPPPTFHEENTETPTAVPSMTRTQNGSVGQAPNLFPRTLDSSLSSLRNTMRIAAATFEYTPSIFRKRKRELFSAKVSLEDDTYGQIDKSHLGAGNSGGDPEPKFLNLFQLEPDLRTMKENSKNEQLSLSDLVLRREGGPQQLGLYVHSLVLLGNQAGECLHEDTTTTVKNPFEGPPKLSIVSSEASSKDVIDLACHQSLSKPPLNAHVTALSGNGQSLDSARKRVSSHSLSVFMDKKLSISEVEILNGSASTASSRRASRSLSSSTHANPSRVASKNVSPLSCPTPSRAESKKAAPSSSATPSTAALKKVSPSSSATPSGKISTSSPESLLQQKIRPSCGTKQLFDQNKGPANQKGFSSNQTRSSSEVRRSSDVDTMLPVPEETIKSSFKGVGYFKRTKRWEAHIWNTEESRQEYLGSFCAEEQAARAYDRATLYFRGVSAKLHFKLEDYTEELPRLEALTKDQLITMLKKQSKGRGCLNPAYLPRLASLGTLLHEPVYFVYNWFGSS